MFTELNSKELEVLEPFLIDPGLEASFRELSRQSDVSTGWVSKIVSEMTNRGILRVEETKTSKIVSTGKRFQTVKRIYNLDSIYESSLPEFLEEKLRPDAIVLFGSFEKGEDTKDSDIDIAIVNGRSKNPDLTEFEEKLHREINITTVDNITDSDSKFRNSIANGTVLKGFLKVV